ncbi:MAG: imidazole glycerol phosphate synthase subunit HisH [Verrucomicrobiota bacterium JB022]|nr:imidazole glycerol phosphate synthase subunit HisH [Verrucomicrobiota bacterium JB022]
MNVSAQRKPDLAVIDYGMGNLRSVLRAWEKVGGAPRLVDHPDDIGAADALIFPGQGAIVDAMRRLQQTGFDRVIRDWTEADRPFFGICLGQQALFSHSEEGDVACLGILPGEVTRFRFPQDRSLKVPHMGWNAVEWRLRLPADESLAPAGDQFYFVHSYYTAPSQPEVVWGRTEYGGLEFCSAVNRGRLYATQFHPEKSQAKGLALYQGFLQSL